MIKLIQLDALLLDRWFTLPLETIQGYPFAFDSRGDDVVYYMSKANLAMGVPERWAYRYFIVSESHREIVGTIGFRTGPIEGCLEVGYNVSPNYRGKGFASAALFELTRLSIQTDPELGFRAKIFSSNAASSRVLINAGFTFLSKGKDEANRDRDVYQLTAEDALKQHNKNEIVAAI